eukprot:TRINITY_DN18172_c0_g1_i3.p1 TRINITY_DN18172_c0_g1~~TRINITY_DN18172_c0_g1_i3.p1  ORF type:complete len:1155 (-),score=454.23 TRINITY_DN18172_c0_g1_i3:369-3833(-)
MLRQMQRQPNCLWLWLLAALSFLQAVTSVRVGDDELAELRAAAADEPNGEGAADADEAEGVDADSEEAEAGAEAAAVGAVEDSDAAADTDEAADEGAEVAEGTEVEDESSGSAPAGGGPIKTITATFEKLAPGPQGELKKDEPGADSVDEDLDVDEDIDLDTTTPEPTQDPKGKTEDLLKKFMVEQAAKNQELDKEATELKRKHAMMRPLVAGKQKLAREKQEAIAAGKTPPGPASGKMLTKRQAKEDKIVAAAIKYMNGLKPVSKKVPGAESAINEILMFLSELQPVGLSHPNSCDIVKDSSNALKTSLAPLTAVLISPRGSSLIDLGDFSFSVSRALADNGTVDGDEGDEDDEDDDDDEDDEGDDDDTDAKGPGAKKDEKKEEKSGTGGVKVHNPPDNKKLPLGAPSGKTTPEQAADFLKKAKAAMPKDPKSRTTQKLATDSIKKIKTAGSGGKIPAPLKSIPPSLAKPPGVKLPGGSVPAKDSKEDPEAGANAVAEAVGGGDDTEDLVAQAIGRAPSPSTKKPDVTSAQHKAVMKAVLQAKVPGADKSTVEAPVEPDGPKEPLATDEEVSKIPLDEAAEDEGDEVDVQNPPEAAKQMQKVRMQAAKSVARAATKKQATKDEDGNVLPPPSQDPWGVAGVDIAKSDTEDEEAPDEADDIIADKVKVSGKASSKAAAGKVTQVMNAAKKGAKSMLLVLENLAKAGCNEPIVEAMRAAFTLEPDAEALRALKLQKSGEFPVDQEPEKPEAGKAPLQKKKKQKKKSDNGAKNDQLRAVLKSAQAHVAVEQGKVNILTSQVEDHKAAMARLTSEDQKKKAADALKPKLQKLRAAQDKLDVSKEVAQNARADMEEESKKVDDGGIPDDEGDDQTELEKAKKAKKDAEEEIKKAEQEINDADNKEAKERQAFLGKARDKNLDCHAELDLWFYTWSDVKKELCCSKNGIACYKPLDEDSSMYQAGHESRVKKENITQDDKMAILKPNCMSELTLWNFAWSEQKITYCCGAIVQCADHGMEGESRQLVNATGQNESYMVWNNMGPGSHGRIADNMVRVESPKDDDEENGENSAALSNESLLPNRSSVDRATKRAIRDIEKHVGKARFIDFATDQPVKTETPNCATLTEDLCKQNDGCVWSKPDMMASLGVGLCEVKPEAA